MAVSKSRFLLVWWMYLVTAGHLLMGIALGWFMHLPHFANYNQLVLGKFFSDAAPAGALDLQIWWINLFGATLQNLAILMLLLIYVANRSRLSVVWGGMIAGLVLWAPQDMWISAQRELWMHLWIDAGALLMMVPPLAVLWYLDRKTAR